ncbi:MAG TPA: hypothetical protein VJ729_17710 [Nitrososphaeraceae archaeon]|nr:hypothetical protein [Nitrososphaeraceae archaeon]
MPTYAPSFSTVMILQSYNSSTAVKSCHPGFNALLSATLCSAVSIPQVQHRELLERSPNCTDPPFLRKLIHHAEDIV